MRLGPWAGFMETLWISCVWLRCHGIVKVEPCRSQQRLSLFNDALRCFPLSWFYLGMEPLEWTKSSRSHSLSHWIIAFSQHRPSALLGLCCPPFSTAALIYYSRPADGKPAPSPSFSWNSPKSQENNAPFPSCWRNDPSNVKEQVAHPAR